VEGGLSYIDRVSGVCVVKGAWDGYARESLATAARDADLSTGYEELGDTRGPRIMNSERLDSQEILSGCDAGWDLVRIRLWRFRMSNQR
jgi:hypothetical protein